MTTDEGQLPEVIASAADEARADEPRAGERARARLRRSGVPGWLDRHRRLLAGLAVVVVAAAATSAYLLTRPPAEDPQVNVAITAAHGANVDWSEVDAHGLVHASWDYVVITRVTGDDDTVRGVVGPGLANPTSTIDHVTATHPGIGKLGASADCSDDRWWTAAATDYRFRVQRTDTYQRTTTTDLPLGAPTDGYWRLRVHRACVPTYVASLPRIQVSAVTPRGHSVDVAVMLANTGSHALWVAPAGYSDGLVSILDGPRTEVPAGGQATVTLSFAAVDCTSAAPTLPFTTLPGGAVTATEGLPLSVSSTADAPQEELVGAWVAPTVAGAARIDAELGTLCPG